MTELILERVREFLVLGDYQAESLKGRGFRVDLGHRWAAMPTAYSSCYWTESAVVSFSGEGRLSGAPSIFVALEIGARKDAGPSRRLKHAAP